MHRAGLIAKWERVGSQPGAFLRAALLLLDLPARIAADDSPLREEITISLEEEVPAARRADEFLERIALEFR